MIQQIMIFSSNSFQSLSIDPIVLDLNGFGLIFFRLNFFLDPIESINYFIFLINQKACAQS